MVTLVNKKAQRKRERERERFIYALNKQKKTEALKKCIKNLTTFSVLSAQAFSDNETTR